MFEADAAVASEMEVEKKIW